MPAQQHCRRRDSSLVRNLDDGVRTHKRAPCASQRTIRCHVDPFFLTVVHDFLLRKKRVVLDLIDSGHNRYLRDQLLEVLAAVVADPDGFHLPACEKLLHVLVCVDMGSFHDQVA